MIRKVLWYALGAVVGYLGGGLAAGLTFLAFVYDAPGGGSGNARYGDAWFAVGAVLGAVIGIALVWRWQRRPGG